MPKSRSNYAFIFLLALAVFGQPLFAYSNENAFQQRFTVSSQLRPPLDSKLDSQLSPLVDPQYSAFLDDLTASTKTAQNTLTFFNKGGPNFEAKFSSLRNANHHIQINAFFIADDSIGKTLEQILIQRRSKNVRVQLVIDSLTKIFSRKMMARMQEAGIEILTSNKSLNPLSFFKHDHRKYTIIDNEIAFIGGGNWSESFAGVGVYETTPWLDTELKIEGPQAQVMADYFDGNWQLLITLLNKSTQAELKKINIAWESISQSRLAEIQTASDFATLDQQTSKELDLIEEDSEPQELSLDLNYTKNLEVAGTNSETRFVVQDPFHNKKHLPLTNYYLHAIQSARTSIFWESQIINPGRKIKKALIEALKRGVAVKIITNSKLTAKQLVAKGGFGYVTHKNNTYAKMLTKHGAQVYFWNGPGALHSKTFVVDQMVTVIGSYNLDKSSESRFSESGLITSDADIVRQVSQSFLANIQNSQLFIDSVPATRKFQTTENRHGATDLLFTK